MEQRDADYTRYQQGLTRTNCLDCLDRTNYTQFKISELLLSTYLGSLREKHHAENPHSREFDVGMDLKAIHESLKGLWNENGDLLSQQYAGSESNISGAIENESQGISHFFTKLKVGVQRLVNNKVLDHDKHRCI